MDESGLPLRDVTVQLLNAKDSTLVKGVATNPSGEFYFLNIKAGRYFLKITCIGFDETIVPEFPIATAGKKEIAGIRLSPSAGKLDAITVENKKFLFEQKPDRMIIDVQHSIVSAGSSVLEILKRSPGVVVDAQNGLISLNGKQGVTIMVNGKPNYAPLQALIQQLAGMNSGNIATIELITTPPSNMDAEGAGGIINIVLKKDDRYGTNGSYSATIGYSQHLVTGASLDINQRKEKINCYGDFNYSLLHSRQEFAISHQTDDQQNIQYSGTTAYRDVTRYVADGRLGIDWQWNKKTELGVQVAASDNKFVNHSTNKGLFTSTSHPDTLMQMFTGEFNDWKSFSANVNLLRTIGRDTKLQFNGNYLYYGDDQPADYQSSFYDHSNAFLYRGFIRSGKKTPIRFWVGALDYSAKPVKDMVVQAGVKASYSSFSNTVEVDSLYAQEWHREEAWSGRSRLREVIPAGYLLLDYTFAGKMTLKGGLRYEFTHTTQDTGMSNTISRQYGYLFPSLVFTYRPDENQTLSFSYNRRITRPTYTDMAQCVIFFDPFSMFAGNPGLLPAISDNWTTDFSFKKYSLSVGYSFEKNSIADFFPTVDPGSNTEMSIARNLRDKQTFSAVITLPVEIFPWWTISFSCTGLLQRTRLTYNDLPYSFVQNSLHVAATQNFRIGKTYAVEVSGFYQSATFFWGAYKIQPYGSLGAGIQRKIGPGRLRLSAENILNTDLWRISIHIPEQNLSAGDRLRVSYPVFKLTWSADFGAAGIRASRKHNTGAEEEQQRVQQ